MQLPKYLSKETHYALRSLVKSLRENGFKSEKNTKEDDVRFDRTDGEVTITICFHRDGEAKR
jgi:hypothetical protein